MPDPIISFQLPRFASPAYSAPLGPGGEVGSLETFTDSVPVTYYAVKVSLETHAGTNVFLAASTAGVCTCPEPEPCPENTARGWH